MLKINNLMKNCLVLLFLSSFLILACNTTNPTKVKKSDTQRITSIQYGYIISSMPVEIKGEGGLIGATAGGLIGGLLGSQLCGDEEIAGTNCQDIAIVYGTIGGATIGYVSEAVLGNHDGYQYVINIDNQENDIALVQGDEIALEAWERIVILYGEESQIYFPIMWK